jgi:hypothetical protein
MFPDQVEESRLHRCRHTCERPLAAPRSPQGRTGRDSPTPTASSPFSFRRAVSIFAACAIPWSVIWQSRVRSAAGRRSGDFGHFVLAGAPISTSAVGSLAATRLRPTRGTSLTPPTPGTTDRSVVIDRLAKKSATPRITACMRFSRASPRGQDTRKIGLDEWHQRV